MPSDADIRGSTTTVEQESGDDAEPRDTDGSRLSTRIKALKGVEATLATAKSAHGILTFFHARHLEATAVTAGPAGADITQILQSWRVKLAAVERNLRATDTQKPAVTAVVGTCERIISELEDTALRARQGVRSAMEVVS
ncbi:hypothetical protein LTS18_008389 [Coniosporium uncinatum]|uniref:Uncharacterized protein n=1 Tax=Coniosporium uncinatum TaxID=93489 RepID=A0ACC3DXE1_9PEZI|nr:hypothetical protein LTS18_008389 [Coniosporium uncinatum]